MTRGMVVVVDDVLDGKQDNNNFLTSPGLSWAPPLALDRIGLGATADRGYRQTDWSMLRTSNSSKRTSVSLGAWTRLMP